MSIHTTLTKPVYRRLCSRTLTAALVITALSVPPSIVAQTVVPVLWSQAVQIARANQMWVPALVEVTERVRDERNEVVETTDLILSIDEAARDLRWELVSAIVNGADRTRAAQNGKQVGLFTGSDDAPQERVFDPALQGSISNIEERGLRVISRRRCETFAFHLTTDEGVWHGDAMIERASGVPIEIHLRNLEGYHESDGRIWNLEATIRYNPDAAAWYPTDIAYTMDLESRIFPFFTFRGRAEVVVQPTEYLWLGESAE